VSLSRARTMERRLWRARQLIKKEPELHGLYTKLNEEWNRAYLAVGRAKLDLARRADKGQVLWTLFFPRGDSGWDRQKVIVRTPRTRAETSSFFTDDKTPVVSLTEMDPYADLNRSWPLPDLAQMDRRAKLVATKPREFWAHNLEAAA
jgi:hypothetical protein